MSDNTTIGIRVGGNPESPWPLRMLGSLGGLVGIVSLFWTEGGNPQLLERVRLAGAIGFALAVIDNIYAAQARRKLSTWISALLVALLAFDRATSPTKHVDQPWWMTVFGAVIAIGALATLPRIYRLWKERSDERDRAIVQGSMSFAFACTLVGLLVYSMLQALDVAPALNPSVVLWVGIGAWVAAHFWLQRQM